MRHIGFDFHAGKGIFHSDRFVERYDEVHSPNQEDHIIAKGMLGPVYISVVNVERGARKRIISAIEADDDDIATITSIGRGLARKRATK